MIKKYSNLKDRRRQRIRAMIKGTKDRPRLSIYRSNKYTYGQLIDDVKGVTLVSATRLLKKETSQQDKIKVKNKTNQARLIGQTLAAQAVKKGIKTAVFDRGGYRYHGRVKALAEGAREGGLKF